MLRLPISALQQTRQTLQTRGGGHGPFKAGRLLVPGVESVAGGALSIGTAVVVLTVLSWPLQCYGTAVVSLGEGGSKVVSFHCQGPARGDTLNC